MTDRFTQTEPSPEALEAIRAARWVFFDLGDTLLDETLAVEDRLVELSRAFARHGRDVSPEALRRALEAAAQRHAARLFPEAVESLAEDPAQAEAIQKEAPPRTDLMPPFPESAGLLAALAPRYALGIIANQTPGTAKRVEAFGWAGHFRVIFASAEAGIEKPDLALFRLAQEWAGCPPERIVMVGDRLDNDVAPAKRLGWRTVRVRQGLTRGQAPRGPEEAPDVTLEHIGELLALFAPPEK